MPTDRFIPTTQVEYHEEVLYYLEYLGYPDIVLGFEPIDVARSIASVVNIFRNEDVSVRFVALLIFGMTMNTQVMNPSVTRH